MTSPQREKDAPPPARVLVLATGGTIAGAACADAVAGYRAAQLDVQALVAGVPALQAHAHAGLLEARQVAQVDSKDMSTAVWRALLTAVVQALARPGVAGVVITHGTDTLEETAYLMHRLLAPAKPVVFTAAMRPATDPSADGPANLIDAVRVAGWPGAGGVLAVMDQQVWAGHEVRKQHTWRMPAFGADGGPLAWVERGAVRPLRPWPVVQPDDISRAALAAALDAAQPWPWVEVVHSHAGADGRIVRLLQQAGVQGLVLAGTGHGTLHEDLESAALQAQADGVAVVRASRVGQGAVWARAADSLPAAGGCSPAQARVELLVQLLARMAGR